MQLPQSFVDPWPEILALLPQKITYKGTPVPGTDPNQLKGFAAWLMQAMPAIVGTGDPDTKAGAFLLWLRSEKTYEADDQTRMSQKAQPLPPQNPISDQTLAQVAQQAQPVAAPAPAAAAPAPEGEEGAKMRCPECQQEISGLRGLKRHVTMTHKAEWPAFCAAHGLDSKTGQRNGAAPAAPVVSGTPPPPPPAPAVAPMFGAQPGSVTNPPTFMAPPPPPAQPTAMPEPAAVVPPGHTPFVPPAVVPPASPPAVAFTPPAPVAPTTGYIPTSAPMQPPAPVAPAPAPAPVAPSNGAPTREALANMLGGPVYLTVVRLLDAAQVDLNGKVDVNQLAALAAARAKSEMKVMDLAQSQYGQGKQAAQRHFADLLTQAPNVYLLLNGYDPILPDGYLEILSSRVVRFHMVQDSGRTIVTIF